MTPAFRAALICALCLAAPGAALAQGWQRISGGDLVSALASRTLQLQDYGSGDTVISFRADGTMTFDDAPGMVANWRVDGERLCTTLPGQEEICGTVERDAATLRLIDESGNATILRYVDL